MLKNNIFITLLFLVPFYSFGCNDIFNSDPSHKRIVRTPDKTQMESYENNDVLIRVEEDSPIVSFLEETEREDSMDSYHYDW